MARVDCTRSRTNASKATPLPGNCPSSALRSARVTYDAATPQTSSRVPADTPSQGSPEGLRGMA